MIWRTDSRANFVTSCFRFFLCLAATCSTWLLCADPALAASRPRLDLTGEWDFYPDVGDAALDTVTAEPGKILVPGSWQAQGYGEPGGSIPSSVVGSDTTPAEYLRHNLTARCLYVRNITVPGAWQRHRVFLCVRRVYRYADVTVNGTRIGEYEGFSSPFEFDVTSAMRFGQDNELVIGVDNRARPGRDTVGMANYFSNTGGFGGAVYLEARSVDWLQDVFAMPRIAASQVQLRVTVKTVKSDRPQGLTVTAEVTPWDPAGRPGSLVGKNRQPLPTTTAGEHTLDLPVALAPLRLWSPDAPFLYVATVGLLQDGRVVDERQVRFGMREITAEGRKLLLNGKPLYLAGYGDDTTYPLTGMMPWDKEVYLRQLRLMRSLGFNFVRHHSCTPHDEYFEAADEVGMLVQPEASMAYVKFWPKAHGLFSKEWANMVTAFRNHPSIWAWCMGNELFLHQLPERDANPNANTANAANQPGTAAFTRQDALKIVERAYQQAKELDPTRLVHASDGGDPMRWTDIESPLAQPEKWKAFTPKPRLLHEYGNYCCSLPDFSLIPRLNGVIRPLTYERAQAYVTKHNLEAVYPRLYHSSLAMRADAQKSYLEAARVNDNSGYSFWLGIDFPESPEGCWDEGILNQLWEPKPGLTEGLPDITGPTVLLTGAGIESRSLYGDEPKTVGLSVSHYGSQPLEKARLLWRLQDGETLLKQGELPAINCGLGEVKSIGDIIVPAVGSDVPRFIRLECELWQGPDRVARNAWEFHAYPRKLSATPRIGVYSEVGPIPGVAELKPAAPLPADLRLLITRALKRERHAQLLRSGKTAVLLIGNGGFKTISRRPGYFLNAHGGAYGGIMEDHPVFAPIPHQGRLHLGLYQLIAGGVPLDAEEMPAALRDGAVVWGLGLTAWISREKNLQRSVMYCDVITERNLHLILCNMDLLSDKPESRYVLAGTIDYLLSGTSNGIAKPCNNADLEVLLR
jgi:beta-galactosidase